MEAYVEVRLIVFYLIFLFIDLLVLTHSDGFSLTMKPALFLLSNFFSTENKYKFATLNEYSSLLAVAHIGSILSCADFFCRAPGVFEA